MSSEDEDGKISGINSNAITSEDKDGKVYGINSTAITVCLLVFMLGIVISNGFVAGILLSRKRLWRIPNFYIIALSFSQLLVGTFVIMSTVMEFQNVGVYGEWCFSAAFIESFAFTSGIFFLIGITTDRFRSILYPLSYKPSIRRTVIVIFLLMIAALIYSTRICIQFAITTSTSDTNGDETNNGSLTTERKIYCNILTEDDSSDIWYRLFDLVVLLFIPIILMVYMYVRIGRKLWDKKVIATCSTRKKRKAVILSIICISSFVICWLPFYIVDIIHDFFAVGTQKNTSGLIYNTIHYITIFLALSNSIINPVIYGFLNANFQQELWILKNQYCCKAGKVTNFENNITSIVVSRSQTS